MNEVFRDGRLEVFEVCNIAEAGHRPKEGLRRKLSLAYRERTVGYGRFFQGAQHSIRIDRLVRCHRLDSVNPLDFVTLRDGKQYQIRQIQYIEDTSPPCMDLSLSAVEKRYEVQT